MTLKSDAKFKGKLACSFKHDKEFGEFSPNQSKVWKFHFDRLFLSKVYMFVIKKYRGVTFHGNEQWLKIWINLDLVVSKLAWGIRWTFIKAIKNWKIYTLMGSFVWSVIFDTFVQSVMLQLANFRGIMCRDTERWYKT